MRKPLRQNKYSILIKSLSIAVISASFNYAHCETTEAAVSFYISPDGSDAASGTIIAPFASLVRARDEVRRYKNLHPTRDIDVFIRGGEYILNETIVFSLEDSSASGQTITYKAYPGEKPVFSSGKKIKGWRKLEEHPDDLPRNAHGKVWIADMPETVNGDWRFYSLFDGQRPLQRARSKGYHFPKNPFPHTDQYYKFKYPSNLLKNWENMEDIEILVRARHNWLLDILPLDSVDPQTKIAKTKAPSTYRLDEQMWAKIKAGIWVENAIDYLDAPGEWVLNTREGRVYYWPKDGSPGKDIVAPVLQEFIRVEGEIDHDGPMDIPVKGLTFEGLTFMHNARDYRYPGHKLEATGYEQYDRGNAFLRFRGAEDCVVRDCNFTSGAGGAVRFDLYAQGNVFEGNTVRDIGGTGISLIGYGPGTKDVNKGNKIINNHFYKYASAFWASSAIYLFQSGDNYIAHNLIHDAPHAGISIIGIAIGMIDHMNRDHEMTKLKHLTKPEKSDIYAIEDIAEFIHTNNNIVENNEIYRVMEVLGDGNAIYLYTVGPGNVIARNFIHSLEGDMPSAIRTDDFLVDCVIEENIIYNVHCSGIMIKLRNHVLNNIIVNVDDSIRRPWYMCYVGLRRGPIDGAQIKRNIFYSAKDSKVPLYLETTKYTKNWPTAFLKDCEVDYNIAFCPENPNWGKESFELSRKDGNDAHSIFADPMFVDLENLDFRLKPESPALKMGFKQIDVTKMGPTEEYASKFRSQANTSLEQ